MVVRRPFSLRPKKLDAAAERHVARLQRQRDGGADREPEERLANLTPLFISVLGGGGGGGGLGGGAALPFSGERVAYNFAATKRAPTPRGEYGVQQAGLV